MGVSKHSKRYFMHRKQPFETENSELKFQQNLAIYQQQQLKWDKIRKNINIAS